MPELRQVSTLNWLMCWLMLSCLMITLLPERLFAGALGTWLADYRLLFVLMMVLSATYFLSIAAIMLFQHVFYRKQRLTRQKLLKELLDYLDASEKAVLREFVIQRRNVIKLPITEPAVKNLLQQGILSHAYGEPGDTVLQGIRPLMVTLEARPLLTFRVLGLNPASMTDEQKSQIMSNRPRYASRQLGRG